MIKLSKLLKKMVGFVVSCLLGMVRNLNLNLSNSLMVFGGDLVKVYKRGRLFVVRGCSGLQHVGLRDRML